MTNVFSVTGSIGDGAGIQKNRPMLIRKTNREVTNLRSVFSVWSNLIHKYLKDYRNALDV